MLGNHNDHNARFGGVLEVVGNMAVEVIVVDHRIGSETSTRDPTRWRRHRQKGFES